MKIVDAGHLLVQSVFLIFLKTCLLMQAAVYIYVSCWNTPHGLKFTVQQNATRIAVSRTVCSLHFQSVLKDITTIHIQTVWL